MSCLNFNSYIFYQFSIIGKVLVKLIKEQATDNSLGHSTMSANQIMVPTVYSVGETWHYITSNSSTEIPVGTTRNKSEYPIWDKLNLVAAVLSDVYQPKVYRLKSLLSSILPEDLVHRQHTTCLYSHGWTMQKMTNSSQPTSCKSSFRFFTLIVRIKTEF